MGGFNNWRCGLVIFTCMVANCTLSGDGECDGADGCDVENNSDYSASLPSVHDSDNAVDSDGDEDGLAVDDSYDPPDEVPEAPVATAVSTADAIFRVPPLPLRVDSINKQATMPIIDDKPDVIVGRLVAERVLQFRG